MTEESNSQSHVISLDRYRHPTFSKEETEALIKLVEKYKTIILNKSIVTAVNHAKEAAWIKIANVFNSQGFQHLRSPDCLKTKWENLKKTAKKVSNNLMDPKYDEFNDLGNPVVTLLCEAEMCSNTLEVPLEIKEDLKKAMKEQTEDPEKMCYDNDYSKQDSDNSDGDNIISRKMRSLNFSPQEKSILLKCVKEEQKYVFSRDYTKNAIQLKRRAWSRITEAFNKRSLQNRSTAVLQTKFNNMKKYVNHRQFKKYFTNKKHKRLVEEEIKVEPQFELKPMSDVEHEDNNGGDSDDVLIDERPDDGHHIPQLCSDDAPGPVNPVLGREFGLGGDNEMRRNRSLNFSPKEVSLLLKCVKGEYNVLFCNENTASVIIEKRKAWMRITEAYNKETEQKRSTRVLKTKFSNLKRHGCKIGRSYNRACLKRDFKKESNKDIKTEQRYGYRSDSDNNNDEEDGDCTNDGLESASAPSPPPAPDPLATVLSSDSGLGSTSFIGAYNFGNDEVTKLKMELLKYQLENAKLERQRIQEAMVAEAAAREAAALERSLRLRAARLAALAAELQLPGHPALHYTLEEAPAQRYIDQYR